MVASALAMNFGPVFGCFVDGKVIERWVAGPVALLRGFECYAHLKHIEVLDARLLEFDFGAFDLGAFAYSQLGLVGIVFGFASKLVRLAFRPDYGTGEGR